MGVENILAGLISAIDDGTRVTISAESLEFAGEWTGSEAPAIGQPASLLLRAEKVRLVERESSAAMLRGRVVASVYKGKYIDNILDTPAGTMHARIWDQERPASGEVAISWDHASARIAPRSPG
jgi:hypothetical protein